LKVIPVPEHSKSIFEGDTWMLMGRYQIPLLYRAVGPDSYPQLEASSSACNQTKISV
jgi:hypothetical protein